MAESRSSRARGGLPGVKTRSQGAAANPPPAALAAGSPATAPHALPRSSGTKRKDATVPLSSGHEGMKHRSGAPRTHRLEELPPGWNPQPGVLSGYRVNYSFAEATRSVTQGGHNEIWNIWTDLAPGMLFAALFAVSLGSPSFASRTPFEQCLVSGVFVACICCRAGSTLTHIYNCVSLRMNQTLVYVDLIGISCMAFGSPWIYYVANGLDARRGDSSDLGGMRSYVLLLGGILAVCLVTFSGLFASGKRPPKFWLPLLVLHAAVGNYPGLQMALDPSFPAVWRLVSLVGVMGFLVGYVVFYTLRVPERWMKPGAADGKWWNSHVIWHVCGDNLAAVLLPQHLPPHAEGNTRHSVVVP